MWHRHPNIPERGANARELAMRGPSRQLVTDATGSAAHDGYTCEFRCPRVRAVDQMVSEEEASRMERAFGVPNGVDHDGTPIDCPAEQDY